MQIINGMAHIKQAKFGAVDLDFVLGLGGYDLDRYSFYFVFLVSKVASVLEVN